MESNLPKPASSLSAASLFQSPYSRIVFAGSIGLLIVFFIVYFIVLGNNTSLNIKKEEKKKVENFENKNNTISISPGSASEPLQKYYVKSSYNSCANKDYVNGKVSVEALSNAISNGCRFLDFEIYDINDEPVVALSNSPNFNFTGSLNYLPLTEIITTIKKEAFTVSNGRDPLFLQFRIKTAHESICNKIARQLRENFSEKLMPPQYGNQYGGKNIATVPLKAFIGKVAIIVDMSNPIIKNTSLAEFVNIGAKTAYNRVYTFNDLAHNPPSDLLNYSKQYLVTSTPVGDSSANYDSSVAFNQGAQFIAMQFQTQDDNLELYIEKFKGYAFLQKPDDLTYKPVIVGDAEPMDKRLGFGTAMSVVKSGSTMQPIKIGGGNLVDASDMIKNNEQPNDAKK